MELGSTFSIVHITDLHFSAGANIEEDHVYSPRQLKGIETVLRNKAIDKLIVTGDLTDAGDLNSLLRAKDWLYGDFSVSGKEKIGLKMNHDKVRVIPGNHDAFNLKEDNPLTYKDRWQKSLSNFYDVFQDAKAVDTDGCRYEWIPFGESGLFLTYVDTSFLGDPHDLEKEKGFTHYLKRIPRVARGTIYQEQTETILKWFSLGVKGLLPKRMGDNETISAEAFTSALKIMIAHHYLFEPPGRKKQPTLQMRNRNAVFVNIASAEYDAYICGHKHVTHFWDANYAKHFDKHSASRHLINLFRRMIDLDAIPFTIKDKHGRKLAKSIQFLTGAFLTIFKVIEQEKSTDDDQKLYDKIIHTFSEAIENPRILEKQFISILQEYDLHACELVSKDELKEISRRIEQRFSKEERKKLRLLADRIQWLARRFATRPFLQVMSGATGKKYRKGKPHRSFNIYTIKENPLGFSWDSERFRWNESIEEFMMQTKKHIIFDSESRILIRADNNK